MSGGIPLEDEDREAWLEAIAQRIQDGDDGCYEGTSSSSSNSSSNSNSSSSNSSGKNGLVIACSALKLKYRHKLRSADPNLCFIFLECTEAGTSQIIATLRCIFFYLSSHLSKYLHNLFRCVSFSSKR